MPYLIDGHNLIPNLPGLDLADLDDEIQLVGLLQDFCRRKRTTVEVYFDRAPTGQESRRKYGQVTAHFISQRSSADAALIKRLHRIAKNSAGWTLVSSDRHIQAHALADRVKVISSQEFSQLLLADSGKSVSADPGADPDAALSTEELKAWLDLFSTKKQK